MVISYQKFIKDFKDNSVQFVTLCILVALSVALLIGLFAYYESAKSTYNAITFSKNLADKIILFNEPHEGDISAIPSDNMQTNLRVAQDQSDDKILEFNYISKNEISKFEVLKGVEFENKEGLVWISHNYAAALNYNIGDIIQLATYFGSEDYKIAGIIESPDYVFYNIDKNSMLPNYEKQGYVYLSTKNLPYDIYNMVYIINEVDTNLNQIFTDSIIIQRNNFGSYSAMDSELKQSLILSVVFSFVFSLVVFVTCYVVIVKYISFETVNIKTLFFLGFRKKSIIQNYQVVVVTLIAISAIVGFVLGLYVILPPLISSQNETICFYARENISMVAYGFAVFAYGCILGTFSFIMIKSNVRKCVKPKQKNYLKDTFQSNLGDNISFVKWGIRQLSLNKFRSIGTLLAMIFSISVFVSALGLSDIVALNENIMFEKINTFNFTTSDAQLFHRDIVNEIETYYEEKSTILNVTINNNIEAVTLKTYSDNDYIHLIDRNYNKIYEEEKSVFVSTFFVEKNGVKEGDVIQILGEDFFITDIYYSSSNLDIYVSSEIFEQIASPEYLYNFYWNEAITTKSSSVISKEILRSEYNTQMSSLDGIIFIEIIIAIIVFIAMTNNTFSLIKIDKKRELSTLKVLGACTSTLLGFVCFEVFLISLGSMIFSVGLSNLILYMIVIPLRDIIYFTPYIKLSSYIFVFFITLVILLLNSIITFVDIKKIKLSESLKILNVE